MPEASDSPSCGSCTPCTDTVLNKKLQVSGGTQKTGSGSLQQEPTTASQKRRRLPSAPEFVPYSFLQAKRSAENLQPVASVPFGDAPIFQAAATAWAKEQRPILPPIIPRHTERMDTKTEGFQSQAPGSCALEEREAAEETETASSPKRLHRKRSRRQDTSDETSNSEDLRTEARHRARVRRRSNFSELWHRVVGQKDSGCLQLDSSDVEMSKFMVLLNQSSKDLATCLQQTTLTIMNHLKEQRQADEKFQQELLAMERERSKTDREAISTIAAAVVGHLTSFNQSRFLNRNSSVESRPESAATTSHHQFLSTGSLPYHVGLTEAFRSGAFHPLEARKDAEKK